MFGSHYGRLEKPRGPRKETGPHTHRTNIDRGGGSLGQMVEVGEPWGPEGFRGVISRLSLGVICNNYFLMVNFVINMRVFFCSEEVGIRLG